MHPHPKVHSPTSHDPQTVRDAMETGHKEPEAADEGRETPEEETNAPH